jgi:hypothetical protein
MADLKSFSSAPLAEKGRVSKSYCYDLETLPFFTEQSLRKSFHVIKYLKTCKKNWQRVLELTSSNVHVRIKITWNGNARNNRCQLAGFDVLLPDTQMPHTSEEKRNH